MMSAFLDWQSHHWRLSPTRLYGSAKIRKAINDEEVLNVIPAKSNASDPKSHDETLYKARNIVERFFCKMKEMRRLAKRF